MASPADAPSRVLGTGPGEPRTGAGAVTIGDPIVVGPPDRLVPGAAEVVATAFDADRIVLGLVDRTTVSRGDSRPLAVAIDRRTLVAGPIGPVVPDTELARGGVGSFAVSIGPGGR